MIKGNEVCDDGGKGGCKLDCSGSAEGFKCTNDNSNTPASTCTPICGDGIINGNEKCDDGVEGSKSGCLPDCSGP